MSDFRGIFPAVVTPFNGEGELNKEALAVLVDRLARTKIQGLFLTGTTGEVFLLSKSERKEIISTALQANNGRKKTIVQVSAFNQSDSIDMAKFAERSGADAISILPPLYFQYGTEQIEDFFRAVADSVRIPSFAYDIPANTGMEIMDTQFGRIFQIPNLMGIKISHQNTGLISTFRAQYPDMIMHIGSDEILCKALELGVDGAVGSTYNALADELCLMYELFLSGDRESAYAIQNIANELMAVLGRCGGTPALKYVLKLQGIDCGECRKPFKTLSTEERAAVRDAYELFCARYAELVARHAV